MEVIDYTFDKVLDFQCNVSLFIFFLKNDRALFPKKLYSFFPFLLFKRKMHSDYTQHQQVETILWYSYET